ncbi:hypothetical protein XENOCAPTIV_000068 [Xenoophorus captivus]|uniref:Uncharacterized protein n=1 Tax=Xenoophorus captivus TaxID=1517983 RepID=A0ABV0RQ35_9TELE
MFPRREPRLTVEAGHGGAPEIAFPQPVSQGNRPSDGWEGRYRGVEPEERADRCYPTDSPVFPTPGVPLRQPAFLATRSSSESGAAQAGGNMSEHRNKLIFIVVDVLCVFVAVYSTLLALLVAGILAKVSDEPDVGFSLNLIICSCLLGSKPEFLLEDCSICATFACLLPLVDPFAE